MNLPSIYDNQFHEDCFSLVEIELPSHREFLRSSALFQGIATNHVVKYSFNLLGFNEGALLIYTFLYILSLKFGFSIFFY